ncbi:MAG: Ni/Fe hydrogenase subunit alpha [Nitrospirota bacterium]
MKKRIRIDYLSRVEGEGGLLVEIKDGGISRLNVSIFESPRFFESFLRGRPHQDIIDFTARICGICPVAYQMSSAHAVEKIFGVEVDPQIRLLRRLFYTGEWIESHALHIYLLQGPDFYGAESAWTKSEYLPLAKKGLHFKKIGNDLLSVLGGRPIHPVSVRTGGFFGVPKKKSLTALIDDLEKAYEESLHAIRWAAGLPFGGIERDMEYVSLRHPEEYPMNEGRVVSNRGLDMTMEEFFGALREHQVERSTALHSAVQRNTTMTPYLVGPLARFNLNFEMLPPDVKSIVRETGALVPLHNTGMGIIARSAELSFAFHEAVRLIRDYEEPAKAFVEYSPRSGTATWITEAPRGMLIHRYELDDNGYVKACTLIPPTSQNLGHMEKDIHAFLQKNLEKPADYLKRECEKIIRSYDPCISCSVHVLVLKRN